MDKSRITQLYEYACQGVMIENISGSLKEEIRETFVQTRQEIVEIVESKDAQADRIEDLRSQLVAEVKGAKGIVGELQKVIEFQRDAMQSATALYSALVTPAVVVGDVEVPLLEIYRRRAESAEASLRSLRAVLLERIEALGSPRSRSGEREGLSEYEVIVIDAKIAVIKIIKEVLPGGSDAGPGPDEIAWGEQLGQVREALQKVVPKRLRGAPGPKMAAWVVEQLAKDTSYRKMVQETMDEDPALFDAVHSKVKGGEDA